MQTLPATSHQYELSYHLSVQKQGLTQYIDLFQTCPVSYETSWISTEILMHWTGTVSLIEKESLRLHSNLCVVMAAHEGTEAV